VPPPDSDKPKTLPRRIRNIAELGRMAGVSAGTVSRALAGNPLVNEKTRDRIVALARLHDFRLNQMARRLRTKQTGVIGVVIPLGHEQRQHISDPFFMTMLGHLADLLTESGLDIMLSRVIPNTDDWLEQIIDSGMLDGLLMIGQSNQLTAIDRVAARYLPLVVWGSREQNYRHCTVGTDNKAGGKMAAAHLIVGGARRIAFLGDATAPENAQRFAGVQAAVAEAAPARLEYWPTRIVGEEMEQDIAAHVQRSVPLVDGIVAASDVIAMTALRVLADHGHRVPEDIRVIGYDDLPLATQTVPRLTTIRQDIGAGAKAMVDALFARIAGHDAPGLEMAPELIVRDSA
jgi:DNA-binding LacI/PurR family transcriptional regulator